jgi:DNA invertase Pin-like site-specific DNA recombinase
MERHLLVERTQSGLARAKSEGKTLERPSKTTAGQRAEIVAYTSRGKRQCPGSPSWRAIKPVADLIYAGAHEGPRP